MRFSSTPRSADSAPNLDPSSLPRLSQRAHLHRLDNGLQVCRIQLPAAPVVTSAVFYRVGTRDEATREGGIAHFLEHMMFKGSAGYGPGEIDRRTQVLGGANNAFTSHDLTAYYFDFAPDRWTEALSIEADRMRGLLLEPEAVDSERRVIEEEIAMYEAEPWDALEQAVYRRLFAGHPYGKPVLGTVSGLAEIGAPELEGFHQRSYRPANAILVVAGPVGDKALVEVETAFGDLPAGERRSRPPRQPAPLDGLQRIERRHGEVARLFLALPGPAAGDSDHAGLRLLLAVLGLGRSSRLQRALVDEGQLCSGIGADLAETLDPGAITLSAEVVPGVEPQRVENRLLELLREVRDAPPSAAEVERARRLLLADWVFGHERVHQQALLAGASLTLFDLEHPERQLGRLLELEAGDLQAVAARWLDPAAGGVLGWSLPSVKFSLEDGEEDGEVGA